MQRRSRLADAVLLGAAILAEVGVGTFASIDHGIAAMTRLGRMNMPRPETQAAYEDTSTLPGPLPRPETFPASA